MVCGQPCCFVSCTSAWAHICSVLRGFTDAQILSFLLCGIVLIFLLARGERFRDALGFIVVLLVASIPIAIEIVRCSRCLPACRRVCALLSPGAAALAEAGSADSSRREPQISTKRGATAVCSRPSSLLCTCPAQDLPCSQCCRVHHPL